uniref:ubiquitinyl hydrolase 1 n=1 Tax=Catharus ustulatus TaxID=91951 RepID=A0A8C3UTW0_CATUS
MGCHIASPTVLSPTLLSLCPGVWEGFGVPQARWSCSCPPSQRCPHGPQPSCPFVLGCGRDLRSPKLMGCHIASPTALSPRSPTLLSLCSGVQEGFGVPSGSSWSAPGSECHIPILLGMSPAPQRCPQPSCPSVLGCRRDLGPPGSVLMLLSFWDVTLPAPQRCPHGPQPSSPSVLGCGRDLGSPRLGGHCFMNAVLQCLSSTKPLRDYCLRRDFQQEQPPAFADVIAALWHPDSSEAVNPGRFKAVFQKYVPSFTGYSQQDAQEFLKFFMDRLHVEINRKGRPPALEDPETLSDDERANQMWKRYLEREDSKIVDLFVGQLKSCLKCQACGYRSTTFEVFCDLSLPIPKKSFAGGKVSLHDCFSLFTKEEELDSENAPVCDKCRQRTRSTKKLTIQRFPRILVLHLNRFSTTRYSIKKCSVFVDFPLQQLNLREFASEKAGEEGIPAWGGEFLGFLGCCEGGSALIPTPPCCRQPCVQPVRAVQPLGQRPLRSLHGVLPRPGRLARLQRLPVSAPHPCPCPPPCQDTP